MKIVNYPTIATDRANFKINYFWLRFCSSITEENYKLSRLANQGYKKSRGLYSVYVLFHIILFCLYLASYLEAGRDRGSADGFVFKLILIICLIVVNVALLLVRLFFFAFVQKKTLFFEVNYFIGCMVFIFGSSPFQYYAFGHTDSSMLGTLGILALILLSISEVKFNYRMLLLFNLIICTFHGIVTILYDSSGKTILQNLVLYLTCLYHIAICYTQELKSRLNYTSLHIDTQKDQDNCQSQLEDREISLSLPNCIEELQKTVKSYDKNSKSSIIKVIKALKVIQSTLQMQDPNYENFTDEIDEEDKIYIQQSCLPTKISEPVLQKKFRQRKTIESIIEKVLGQETIMLLKQVSTTWNIDMFYLNEKCEFMPVTVLGRYCMRLYNLTENFGIPELKLGFFFSEVQKRYKNNPYHNAVHAADVLASGLYLLKNSDLFNNLVDVDMLAVIIAHLTHDVAHPGVNNRFLINFRDELAVECKGYVDNDISVLESMHASVTFKILNEKDKNILDSLSKSQFLIVRKMIIELILSTDMAKHFDLIAHFRSKCYKAKEMTQSESKIEGLKLVIHSADIGHTAKETDLHKKWSKLLSEEFFHQGDIEKEANEPVSMYCDRETTILSKSQIGFLKNIALPLFDLLTSFLNSDSVQANCLDQLKSNISAWEFEYSSGKLQTLRMTDASKLGNDVNSPFSMITCKSMAYSKTRLNEKN